MFLPYKNGDKVLGRNRSKVKTNCDRILPAFLILIAIITSATHGRTSEAVTPIIIAVKTLRRLAANGAIT